MSRILLANDSPHAQRMGERILLEEGYEVVTVTDGETALVRLNDVDPDVILADVLLPLKSGYEICRHVKEDPRHRHARVVLLAGPLERVDEQEFRNVRADALLRKPLEASAVLETVKSLAQAARLERDLWPEHSAPPAEACAPQAAAARRDDAERIRAAVTLALDAALPALGEQLSRRVSAAVAPALDAALPEMIEELTQRVLEALKT